MGQQGAVGKYMSGSTVLPTGRYKIAMDDVIADLNINKTPLLLLLSKIGKKSVGQMKFEWMTEERMADFVDVEAVGGGWAAGDDNDGTITVSTDDVWMFAEGDVILMPALSQTINMFVESVVQATGVITAGTVTGADVNLSGFGSSIPGILRLGSSFEVGGDQGTIKSQDAAEEYNYIQIHQTPAGITTTDKNVDYRGGDKFTRDKRKAAIEHAFGIEKTFFFGQRHRADTGRIGGVYAQYFSNGIENYLSSYVTNVAGALTQTAFVDWLIDCTKYAEEPVVFAGELIFEALYQWAESKLSIENIKEDTLGMYVYNYVTPYGKRVKIIPHRDLLTDDLTGKAFCVDIQDLEYKYLQNLDTHLEVGIQDNGVRQDIDEYRTWCGIKVGNQKRHGLIYGVTSITT